MPQYKLDQIKKPHEVKDQHKDCLIQTLQKWVNKAANLATWKRLHDAAIAVEKKPAADKIKNRHDNLDQQGIENILGKQH